MSFATVSHVKRKPPQPYRGEILPLNCPGGGDGGGRRRRRDTCQRRPRCPLIRWKQWTVDARKKLVMMATTDTEMPEKMMMSRSVSVSVAWHSRKLSLESWLRETRRPSMGSEHSMPSTPRAERENEIRQIYENRGGERQIYGNLGTNVFVWRTLRNDITEKGKHAVYLIYFEVCRPTQRRYTPGKGQLTDHV
ncbi:hypothetical protein EYF80_045180 [Liparis tanakae]|uniref:Uncharacterized protein n=1 Tax=Liparis tanakae TaxID=230148 RepID=A0A4Z2FUP5_9TELE|nr:hypothetical protein EYF80_045180 [Liparis tanakae]